MLVSIQCWWLLIMAKNEKKDKKDIQGSASRIIYDHIDAPISSTPCGETTFDLCDLVDGEVNAYLQSLIKKYEMPLSTLATGVYNLEAEAFNAVSQQDSSVFDFGFEYIISDDNGENETHIENVCSYISETNKRVVLLGEPGCGKTISIAKLTGVLAQRALLDKKALVPITISLGSYKEDIPLDAYINKFLNSRFNIECSTSKKERYIFIFDALNEVAVNRKNEVVKFIKDLPHYIVSCRILDYNKDFEKEKNVLRIEIQKLNIFQIQNAINTFDSSKKLWRDIGGCDELSTIYNLFLKLDEIGSFWKSPYEISEQINAKILEQSSTRQYDAWLKMHQLGLLPLCQIPLFLRLVCDIWKNNSGMKQGLPSNRGKVLEEFAKQCFEWERNKINKEGESNSQKICDEAFSILVYLSYMITINEEGTGIEYGFAKEKLKEKFPAVDLDKIERFVQGAGILILNSDEYRFAHQLHQEYFASQALSAEIEQGESLECFFDSKVWWKPSGWEEPAIILTGILHDDAREKFFESLAMVQPELLFRCINNSGVYNLQMSNKIRERIKSFCVKHLHTDSESAISRIHIGQVLEKLQKDVELLTWIPCGDKNYISKYPVTNEQFLEFVREGYDDLENWSFSNKAIDWHHNNPFKHRQLSKRMPAVYVSWYEAMAYCQWASKKYTRKIRLLSVDEWIRFIGDNSKSQRSKFCYSDLLDFYEGIIPTVGLGKQNFKDIISDVGLVWEWCIDETRTEFNNEEIRFLKGGSYVCSDGVYGLSNFLFETYPCVQTREIGFRVLSEL